MTTAILIDADWLLFNAVSSATRELEWEDGIVSSYTDIEEAKFKVKDWLTVIHEFLKIPKESPEVKTIMALTCPKGNFRKALLPTYKGTRTGKAKPVGYGTLKEWLRKEYTCDERLFMEGDDVLGILSTDPGTPYTRKVIVSPDKDMNTVPGEFLWIDPRGGNHELKTITTEEAERWLWKQTLMGDITDGYQGLPGMGATGSEDFLDSPYVVYPEERILKSGPRKGESETIWKKREPTEGETLGDCVLSLYQKAGLTERDMLVQYHVARVAKFTDLDSSGFGFVWNLTFPEGMKEAVMAMIKEADTN